MTTDIDSASMISVIIPVHNGTDTLRQCLEAVDASDYTNYECVVVDDGSTDGSADVARQLSARVLELKGGPAGPAHARNQGAEIARGDTLFFIDADVVIRPDTLSTVGESFAKRPDIAALFGSYDESPAGTEFLSQYKNLVHHFVHQQGSENAATFWTGCGAVRRDVFQEVGGFDKDKYPQPSIEDIELGYRLKAAGYEILLNKELQVKHLKKWSLKGLIQTDVFGRALPWTRLIMQAREVPNDLNLQTSQRLSALLLYALLLFLLLNIFQENFAFLPLLTALFLLLVNGWHWREEPAFFKMSLDTELATYILLVTIGLLAFFSEMFALLLVTVLLFLVVLIGRTVSPSTPSIGKILFVVMMLALSAAFVLSLLNLPLWLTAPILLILATIVALNRQLYWFFMRKRGLIFALAALPFQLFYYFYSVLVFIIGGGLHIWENQLRLRQS